MNVCSGLDGRQRDTTFINQQMPLAPLFSPIRRVEADSFLCERCLQDGTVHALPSPTDALHLVEVSQARLQNRFEDAAGADPLHTRRLPGSAAHTHQHVAAKPAHGRRSGCPAAIRERRPRAKRQHGCRGAGPPRPPRAGWNGLILAIIVNPQVQVQVQVQVQAQTLALPELQGRRWELHPVHLSASAADPRPRRDASRSSATGTLQVPPRTAVVCVER